MSGQGKAREKWGKVDQLKKQPCTLCGGKNTEREDGYLIRELTNGSIVVRSWIEWSDSDSLDALANARDRDENKGKHLEVKARARERKIFCLDCGKQSSHDVLISPGNSKSKAQKYI
jgi:hypothetical protein